MCIFNSFLDSVAGASPVTLRLITVYFTQFLPLGPRYLPIIYSSFIVYLISIFISYFSKSRRPYTTPPSLILFPGLYEPRRNLTSLLALSLNCFTLLAALDFVFRPQVLELGNGVNFSRLGYIDSTTARIILQDPKAGIVKLEYSIQDSPSKETAVQTKTLLPENDFVTTFLLKNLQPDTKYTYHTNTTHNLDGTFHTASPHPKKWSMLSTSCLKPGYPYRPMDNQLRITGLEYLDSYISKEKMEFMLFLGDFIYIDLPVRFGVSKESYREAYRRVYASPSWTEGLRGLGWMHTYDDHEFENDWAQNTTGLFGDAVGPWGGYQGVKGGTEGKEEILKGKSWYTFSRGDVEFFVADARKYRDADEMEDGEGKSMLGAEQFRDLEEWLKTAKGWKIFCY